MKNLFSLEGKTILLTGGNGHLGIAMLEILCEYGAKVIIASRNKDKNDLLCKSFKTRFGYDVESIFIDLDDINSVNFAVEKVIQVYKRIDVLINNAGYSFGTDLISMTEADWLKGLDGTINGCYRLTKAVLVHMISNGGGKIVNVSSMYGIVAPDVSIYEGNGFYNPANYGVGKAGIIHFTKYVAAVYGKHGINSNCISPGPFPSNKVQLNNEFIDKLITKVPLNRIGNPNDLKGVVLLLASDASGFINGVNIAVDGGWTSW